MARRRSLMSDTSSLELLLDTICNTFGGIVFVSLLVVILVNMSSRETADTPPEPVTQAEMLKKQTELESLRQDLKELQTTLNQQSRVSSQLVSESSRQMAQQLQLSSARLAEAVQQNNDLVSQVTDLQNEVNQIAENLAEQRRKLQQTSEELARVTARADQLLSRNSRTARLPTVRGWTGQGTAAFFLKEGSLCYLRDPRQSAERIVDGSTIIEPVPSAGLRIDPARTDQAALETLFRRFSTQRHLIRIWVAPDSHEQWGAVRDTVVRLGFRYQLEPIPPDQYLILTDSPTAELRAQ